ncbi:MAG: DUF5110 domain-containing protein, partial [Anaerolineae bacterium]|nr:DUF5110 domain-containing protein [Anaerolineae bacterium]
EAASGVFTLIEDDGVIMAYQDGAVRETPITFTADDGGLVIMVGAVSGTYDGAPDRRSWRIRLVGAEQPVASVTFDGEALPEADSLAALDDLGAGWFAAGNELIITTGSVDVTAAQTIEVTYAED